MGVTKPTSDIWSILPTTSTYAGDWYLFVWPDDAFPGTSIDYMLTINVAPVPLPAAIWLFSSTLAEMLGLGFAKNVNKIPTQDSPC
jgi:hypothetical protein